MPAVINVGGPVAWGLVVLISAWAVRVGRALSGRRRSRRQADDDVVCYDPNAPQPRYLQHLSATAIRMLIETGALPCAVIELSDGGCGVGCHSTSEARACRAADARGASTATGPAAGGSSLPPPPPRIVPPDLAGAVPCMSAAAWVRALPGHEAWRAELTRAASASVMGAGGGGGISSGGPGPSLRSSNTSLYTSMSLSRDAASGTGTGVLRPRLSLLPQPSFGPGNSGNTGGGAAAGGGGGGGGGSTGILNSYRGGSVGASEPHHPQQQHVQSPGGTDGSGGAPSAPSFGTPTLSSSPPAGGDLSPGAASFPHQTSQQQLLYATSSGFAAAAVAAAAATNMAALPYPPRHALLVVLGRDERVVAAVTAAAAAGGFSRVATWVGPPESFAATSLLGPRLPAISRHALWLVLQLGPDPLFHVPALVLDVRRPDERLAYGAIRGTVNVPADELAAALALPPTEFRLRYGVAPPGPDDLVVMTSRSGRRAAWAAQLCVDAGLQRVFVYGEGVYGWRLEDRVKPYRAYDLGGLPPDPEPFTPDDADEAAGFEELHSLGMPMRQGPRPSRFAVTGAASAASAAAPGPAGTAAGGGGGGGALGPLGQQQQTVHPGVGAALHFPGGGPAVPPGASPGGPLVGYGGGWVGAWGRQ